MRTSFEISPQFTASNIKQICQIKSMRQNHNIYYCEKLFDFVSEDFLPRNNLRYDYSFGKNKSELS